MSTVDNELNWRKVFPSTAVDVSGWTLAQRMALPDWCFPNRYLVCCYKGNAGVGTYVWNISPLALPDPACIWQVIIISAPNPGGTGELRIGLNGVVPTTLAEMNAVQELFPGWGFPKPGPDSIMYYGQQMVQNQLFVRHGLVTGGKKLVIEVYCAAGAVRWDVILVVSGLPTKIPAFLDPEVT